jgi:LPS O-antigen subunit length determinant protein (WzzB/FepE family)
MNHPASPTSATPSQHGPQPAASQSVRYREDEIDLLDLVAGVWRQRVLVGAVACAVLALAILYAWGLATPVYRSESAARPAAAAMLLPVNEALRLSGERASLDGLAPERTITPNEAMARVAFEIRSQQTQRRVFDRYENQIFAGQNVGDDSDSLFLRRFVPDIAIAVRGLDEDDVLTETTVSVAYQHPDPALTAEVSNALIQTAHERAVTMAIEDLRASLANRLTRLREELAQAETLARRSILDEIERLEEADERQRRELTEQLRTLRNKAEALRSDRITQLDEALAIARALGIEEPQSIEINARGLASTESAEASTISLAFGSGQEYLKGMRLLEAELAAVRSRESDDAFTPAVREIEAKLAMLETNPRIELLKTRENHLAFVESVDGIRKQIARIERASAQDFSKVRFMQLDQPGVAPREPIKPRRMLITAAALVAGLILGVLVALVVNAAARQATNASSAY